MTIIIRNPFVSKTSKELARQQLRAAYNLMNAASTESKRSDSSKEYQLKLLNASRDMWNRAARNYGFRNAMDMDRYFKKHKTFP